MERFKDRSDAGKRLAQKLSAYADHSDVILLALPRGGVPVAFEVSLALNAPLDIFVVRKLGVPGREELAMGTIASTGIRVINDDIVRILNIHQEVINIVAQKELKELELREHRYRGERSALDVHNRTVILINDGLATGASMRAASVGIRAQQPARIVIAVPVAAPETCDALQFEADEMVCVLTPEPFSGLNRWYENFSQTTDQEVRMYLEEANDQLLRR